MNNTVGLIKEYLQKNKIKVDTYSFIEEVSNTYHAFEAECYDSRHYSIQLSKKYWKASLNFISGGLNKKEKLKVLDFGCGTGFASEVLLSSTLAQNIKSLHCYDLSPDMIEVCKEKFNSYSFINYLSGKKEFQDIIANGGKFNLILVNAVLHHLPDPKSLIDLVLEVLEDGGVFVIGHEPNKLFYESAFLKEVSNVFRMYKKVQNRFKRVLFKKKLNLNNDIVSLTYQELFEKRIIPKEFDKKIIPKLVDIHVPISSFKNQPWGELGFNFEFINSLAEGKFKLLKMYSYNQIKDQTAYKMSFWRKIGEILEFFFPYKGSDSIYIIRK